MTVKDENAELERIVAGFDHYRKIAFSAGFAQRLFVLLDGVRDRQYASAIQAVRESLDLVWPLAVEPEATSDHDVEPIIAGLQAHLEDEDDPGFTWVRPILNDALIAALYTLEVASTDSTEAAIWSRSKLIDTLDYIAEEGAPEPRPTTGAEYVARGDLPFFTTAKSLIAGDIASSSSATAHRVLTTTQGSQLLGMVNDYRAQDDS